jgi:hypothetical protein
MPNGDAGMVSIVTTFEDATSLHPRRRLVVVQRRDALYSYAIQYFYRSEFGGELTSEGWVTLPPEGIYPTPEMAASEGLSTIGLRV